ncbi:MAG: hypothetical protein EXS37_13415 [Opitutus sp.]|nr:hypothetical protein [Opitutus sp.]
MPITSYADDPLEESWRLDCAACRKIYRAQPRTLAATKGSAWVLSDDDGAWATSWQELMAAIDLACTHHRQHHLGPWMARFAGLSGAATVRLINEAVPGLGLRDAHWRGSVKLIGREKALAAVFGPVEAIRPIARFLRVDDATLEALVSRYEVASERHRVAQVRLEAGAVSCRGRGAK